MKKSISVNNINPLLHEAKAKLKSKEMMKVKELSNHFWYKRMSNEKLLDYVSKHHFQVHNQLLSDLTLLTKTIGDINLELHEYKLLMSIIKE